MTGQTEPILAVRTIDLSGMSWEGKDSYDSIDEALEELNDGLAEVLEEIYG